MLQRLRAPNLYGWLVVAVSFAALSLVFSARSSLGLAWSLAAGWTGYPQASGTAARAGALCVQRFATP